MSSRTDHFFIYPKDKQGNRTGHTICVLLRNGMMFEGTSLCSKDEQFSRKVGRTIAYDRAIEAYKNWIFKCNKPE